MENRENGKGLAIASMVLGIIGVLLIFIGLGPISLLNGILSVVFSSLSKKKGYEGGMRIAGLILGIISIVIGVISIIALVCIINFVKDIISGGIGEQIEDFIARLNIEEMKDYINTEEFKEILSLIENNDFGILIYKLENGEFFGLQEALEGIGQE